MNADVPEATLKEPRSKRLRSITPVPPRQAWTEDAACLHEAGAELAVVLWRVLHRVREWAECAPDERGSVFPFDRKAAVARLVEGCTAAPEVLEAFGTFALLLRAPERIEARRLAEACHQVYAWAEEKSLVKVGMLFAEAAALVEMESPTWANIAGRMCRRAARDERAESWYHRAFGLAVRTKDQGELVRALLGYGALMKDLGNYEEARRYYEKAATRAVHSGRRRQAGEAHHDLLTIAAERGTYTEGERHVRRALDFYPIHHPRLPALAHDWAFLLIRLHHYTPAVSLLEMAAPRAGTPALQTLFWSTLAWASAGVKRRERFDKVEQVVLRLIPSQEEFTAAALIHLAEGARRFELWDQAESYAASAASAARSRKDTALEEEAHNLLSQVTNRESAPLEQAHPDPDRVTGLGRILKARLRKWDAPNQRRPGATSGDHKG